MSPTQTHCWFSNDSENTLENYPGLSMSVRKGFLLFFELKTEVVCLWWNSKLSSQTSWDRGSHVVCALALSVFERLIWWTLKCVMRRWGCIKWLWAELQIHSASNRSSWLKTNKKKQMRQWNEMNIGKRRWSPCVHFGALCSTAGHFCLNSITAFLSRDVFACKFKRMQLADD